jgi:hypothetical protein
MGKPYCVHALTMVCAFVIQFHEHCKRVTAEVNNLGKNQMILDYMWLSDLNTEIDWTTGTVQPTHCP